MGLSEGAQAEALRTTGDWTFCFCVFFWFFFLVVKFARRWRVTGIFAFDAYLLVIVAEEVGKRRGKLWVFIHCHGLLSLFGSLFFSCLLSLFCFCLCAGSCFLVLYRNQALGFSCFLLDASRAWDPRLSWRRKLKGESVDHMGGEEKEEEA